jgi:ribosome-associated toxin RatA of RatAB toxin-antitoxin module
MQVVEKNVLVAHSAARMFALVDDVEHYPSFLPWCRRIQVHARQSEYVEATLYLDYLKISQHFTTRNTYPDDQTILIKLVEGPFDDLLGRWHFQPLGEQGCKIVFRLSYQFSNTLLEKLIGPVFGHISRSLVEAFVKEADRLYKLRKVP